MQNSVVRYVTIYLRYTIDTIQRANMIYHCKTAGIRSQ